MALRFPRPMLPRSVLPLIALGLALPACQPVRPPATPAAPAPDAMVNRMDAMPEHWNGTLLLFSRGYSRATGQVALAPENSGKALLDAGYALAASDYGTGGWALEPAVPAPLETISWFAARHGTPRRVIAYGNSMGGLVSVALAEQAGSGIDGAIAFCPSIGGAVGMMNMALDGAFAFRTLIAPSDGIELVRISDDRANGKRVDIAVERAMGTAEGRARIALAAVLGGLPDWTVADAPQPIQGDDEAIVRQQAAAFTRGIFLPRQDQEARAGGNFSWNIGTDYHARLLASGRRAYVERLYARAGLRLEDDLAQLSRTLRIAADPDAKNYMITHYTPTARPRIPLLAVQKIGDGMTSPTMLDAYEKAAPPAVYASAWVKEAGHCAFTPAQVLASIKALEERLDEGRWPDLAQPPFHAYRSTPMPRPCFRDRPCQ